MMWFFEFFFGWPLALWLCILLGDMNKLGLLVLSLAVAGCTATKTPKPQHPEVNKDKPAMRNRNCVSNIKKIEVINTLDRTHALVHYYTKDDEKRPRIGMFANYAHNILLYDELEIKAPAEHCAVINDTFTYENKEIGKKTGPIITFEYKNMSGNKNEAMQTFGQAVNNMKRNMCTNNNQDLQRWFKDKKHCQCTLDAIYDASITYTKETLQKIKNISNLPANERKQKMRDAVKLQVDNMTKYVEEKCGAMKKPKIPQAPVSKTVMLDGKPVKVTYKLEWFLNFGWYEKSPNNSGK